MALSAFNYAGAKIRKLDWLLPLLPECEHYVEPFAGSLSVLLNRPRSAAETVNDINANVTNFFRVLRDRPDELMTALYLTPYSRDEYERSWHALHTPGASVTGDVERARMFYVATYASMAMGVRVHSLPGFMAPANGASKASAQYRKLVGEYPVIQQVADRLRSVTIENRDAMGIIERFMEKPGNLLYCDPPYVMSSRGTPTGGGDTYAYDWSDDQHAAFLDMVCSDSCRARIAISGYRSDLYGERLSGWRCAEREYDVAIRAMAHGNRGSKVECLWMNFDDGQEDLFPPSELKRKEQS